MKREFKMKGVEAFPYDDSHTDKPININYALEGAYEIVEQMGFDPIEFLIGVAKDENNPLQIRLSAAIEINQSMYPHPVVVEYSGPDCDPCQE